VETYSEKEVRWGDVYWQLYLKKLAAEVAAVFILGLALVTERKAT
jgi:hypothetical protein